MIHANGAFPKSLSFLIHFIFPVDNWSLVSYVEVMLAIKPPHPSPIGNICLYSNVLYVVSSDIRTFTAYVDVPSRYFPQKELLIQQR